MADVLPCADGSTHSQNDANDANNGEVNTTPKRSARVKATPSREAAKIATSSGMQAVKREDAVGRRSEMETTTRKEARQTGVFFKRCGLLMTVR